MMRYLIFLGFFTFFACKQNKTTSDADILQQDGLSVSIENNKNVSEPYIILGSSFMGVNCNDKIEMLKANKNLSIVKDTIQNGEGDFEVYNLNNKDGTLMALLFPNFDEEEAVHQIVVISPLAKTPEGISPGQTFGDILKVYKNVKVNGSEIEGWTHAETNNYYFKLDTFAFGENIDLNRVGKKLSILEIRGKCN